MMEQTIFGAGHARSSFAYYVNVYEPLNNGERYGAPFLSKDRAIVAGRLAVEKYGRRLLYRIAVKPRQ